MTKTSEYYTVHESDIVALEAIARRMMAVFSGATERRERDNPYDWAQALLTVAARMRE